MKKWMFFVLAGAAAGSVTGLFGAGGGMVLVPLLTLAPDLGKEAVFPTSVAIILPICLVSILAAWASGQLRVHGVFPYLAGSALGGIAAGVLGPRIPVRWLHRSLGLLILWGGIRYLC